MNAFRATVLVLLVLTVGLMFYAFVVLIPARQNEYQMYQTQLKINEYEQRQMEHDARMARMDAGADTPEMAAARAAAAESDKKNEEELASAEEHSVISSAKRRQEIEASAESAEDEDATAATALGTVTAYLEDCAVILFKADGSTPVSEGLQIALRRGELVVGEATVDGRDEESGQYTAVVKQVSFGGVKDPVAEEKRVPRPGDEVIISPFLSSRDLRLENADYQQPDEKPQALPEVDAVFTPVP